MSEFSMFSPCFVVVPFCFCVVPGDFFPRRPGSPRPVGLPPSAIQNEIHAGRNEIQCRRRGDSSNATRLYPVCEPVCARARPECAPLCAPVLCAWASVCACTVCVCVCVRLRTLCVRLFARLFSCLSHKENAKNKWLKPKMAKKYTIL